MTEEERQVGKFIGARDEVLYAMCNEGWANESSGDVQSITGWFARISILHSELLSVELAFEEDIRQAKLYNTAQLIGHHLVSEDELGSVEVHEFESEDAVKRVYDELEREYCEWLEEVEDSNKERED